MSKLKFILPVLLFVGMFSMTSANIYTWMNSKTYKGISYTLSEVGMNYDGVGRNYQIVLLNRYRDNVLIHYSAKTEYKNQATEGVIRINTGEIKSGKMITLTSSDDLDLEIHDVRIVPHNFDHQMN